MTLQGELRMENGYLTHYKNGHQTLHKELTNLSTGQPPPLIYPDDGRTAGPTIAPLVNDLQMLVRVCRYSEDPDVRRAVQAFTSNHPKFNVE